MRERVLEAIQQKVDGQEITAEPPAERPEAKIIDLMEALKASLAKRGATTGGKKSAKSSGEAAKPAKKRASKAS